ncbi:thiol reductant ABC exporter subunit CydD [Hoyosella altamirensis]|uniref:ATP-binding cassette subfamily C protein CydD n=1 Tax=Hoyosella altamirensis TaxID=616997 RepID=A0A839RLV1_9ACTN|nr:thiol reductant ABC exporter subunit CydD [Hoyosella altamirensis]MBB3037377.1 ATP-binding cassette subfamily C protein CydD [Hoyosella altamirensis]
MKPFDPRLWRLSAPVRPYLVLTVVMGVVTAVTVIVMALMIATILAGVVTDPARRVPSAWSVELAVLAGAVLVRAAAMWLHTRFAHRSSAAVIRDLKMDVLRSVATMPPRDRAAVRDETATVVTHRNGGLDGLGPYLTGYLPALALAAIVPPAVLVVIAVHDMTSALIIFFTLPLIPTFMILIGLLTRGKSRAKLRSMSQLSAQLLDLIAGLPTLRSLARERGQTQRVRELGEQHRHTTMASLRIAFLSSMVLEMFATLCVALVAVSVGLRLVYGNMELQPGLVALILAAEVYLPLRMVGAQFHAAEDGVSAADRAFSLLVPRATTGAGGRQLPVGPYTVVVAGLRMRAREGFAPDGFSAEFRPGETSVITGPNGAGKTTALHAILGLVTPDGGAATVNGIPVPELDIQQWWDQIAWVPQKPVLIPGTVRENLELNGPIDDIARAAEQTGFGEVLAELPDGLETRIGSGGTGLSLGQRQRLALTRAFASNARVLIFDEPTAHLDDLSADRILDAMRARAATGATVLAVSHHARVLAAADQVTTLGTSVRRPA